MTQLITALAAFSAIAYAACIVLIAANRLRAQVGTGSITVAAVLAFIVARVFPQSTIAAECASLVFIIALLRIVRRSSGAIVGILAAIPIAAMLLVVDRPFFPESIAAQFQTATIALLCAAGPIALVAASTLLLRRM